MSSIYIQEPPTSGKVLLHTTVGDIDVEIWSREAPKACRNFVQLCMESYYDGTCFHRLVKGFIAQGGDPTGTGHGGDSIYGKPFKDEFHSRLRFVRRGLVAMANAGKDDNGSQFFFTLDACPELQNKHTIFGKVTGNTLYNMLKLEESLTDHNERPLYPHKIITTKVISNPFPDIVPRSVKKSQKEKASESDEKKAQAKGTKNFNLLSFGEEAEEEEAETDAVVKEYRKKSKSSHDLTDDPKLSSVPAVEAKLNETPVKMEYNSDEEGKEKTEEERLEEVKRKAETLSNIKKKLKKEEKVSKKVPEMSKTDRYYQEKTETEEKKRENIRNEIKKIKKELSNKKKEPEKVKEGSDDEEDIEDSENSLLNQYHKDRKKYKEIKKTLPKGVAREKQTLEMLKKFESKLLMAKEKDNKDEIAKREVVPSDEEDEDAWLTHHLSFEDEGPIMAKDANLKTAESYDISDPRNPMNERRREKGKSSKSSGSGSGKRH